MADETPLLFPAEEATSAGSDINILHSLDSIIERYAGDSGLPQLLKALIVSLAWFFDAQQCFIAAITDANPKWHCTTTTTTCNSASNICDLPLHSWSWDSPSTSFVLSEWNLHCAPPFLSALPSSSFFLGCLIGGFTLATLADFSLGRKNTLLLSTLIMSLSTFFTAFSTNIWTYSAFRFLSGFGRANIGTCALVLSTELVAKRWRSQIGVSGFFFFTLGFLSLPLLAYANINSPWRNLYIWTSIPAILYSLIIHFSINESPRWLFVQGRTEEAINSINRTGDGDWDGDSSIPSTAALISSIKSYPINESERIDFFSAIKMLGSKKWCVQRLSAVMAIALGTGMAYYGMPLGIGNLGMNLYLGVTVNALSELAGAALAMVVIGRLQRRAAVVGFAAASGICSVLSVTKATRESNLHVGLESGAFLCACTTVNVVLMFTIELFPTVVRNTAMSMVRQALVIGGVMSPMLVALAGRFKMEVLSYGVFGIVIASCGVFAVCLPETKGKSICDTMDEQQIRSLS